MTAISVLILFALFNASFNVSFHAHAQGGDARLPDKKAAPEKKPAPAPAPRSNVRSSRPAEPAKPVETSPLTLSFNQEAKSQLDPRATEKFADFLLNARSGDWLTIKLSSGNPALSVQLLNKDGTEVGLTKDAATGEYKLNTPMGGVPADGEYRVRVAGPVSGRTAVPFTIKVNRLGLTTNAYNERFQKILLDFRENDPASVDDTLAKLEELTREDSSRAGAFEFLGIIYLSQRHDVVKAEAALEQALKLNGAAVIKISFDSQWRRLAKLRSGKVNWEDARTGWLRIRPGQLQLTDPGHRPLAALNSAQIKEVGRLAIQDNYVITLSAENTRRPFIFAPSSLQLAEADLVLKLIQTHVLGKTNSAGQPPPQ